MSKVAVLGAGSMGSRMVISLLTCGHEVTVWNRDSSRVLPLLEKGATSATSPCLAAKKADYVISVVRDDEASRKVWVEEENGALSGMSQGAVAIESSTLTVNWIKALATYCEVRNITFLDAPVAGSRPQAEAAELIYFVGGEATVFERTKPLLLAMGKAAYYTGPCGSGAAVKLMVNALFGIQLAALGELIGFIRRLGLSEVQAIEALASTPVCSLAVKTASEAMCKSNFSPKFPIELVVKDFSYVLQTATSSDAAVPMSEMAYSIFSKALEEGYGQNNISGVVQLYQ